MSNLPVAARAQNIVGTVSVETHHIPWPQAIVRFSNGYGASVVQLPHAGGRLEIAVLNAAGELDYSTPITSDVIPGLTQSEAMDVLREIAML